MGDLGMTPLHSRNAPQLALKIRAELEAQKGDYPTLQQVAGKFCVSARTLKRRLRHAGASYRELLDGVRLLHAQELLRLPGMSLEAVAAQLGYSSSGNLSRAFRRWTGKRPGYFRTEVSGAASPPEAQG